MHKDNKHGLQSPFLTTARVKFFPKNLIFMGSWVEGNDEGVCYCPMVVLTSAIKEISNKGVASA